MTRHARPLITQAQIADKVQELAAQITAYYQDSGKDLVLVGLLRGSVIFMADLCRAIDKAHTIDFMTVSSYGSGTTAGEVKIVQDLSDDIHGKDVLIVEDIIDSGRTLNKVLEILKTRAPASIEICTIVSKPSRREVDIFVRFLGFEVPDIFIVGYGLDYDQAYRHLPYIGEIGL